MKHKTHIFMSCLKYILVIITIMNIKAPVFAASKEPAELTLKDAIYTALAASTQMKGYKSTKDSLQKEQESLSAQYSMANDPAVLKSLSNQISQNRSKLAVNEMNITLCEQKMEITMMKAFANVINAENALALYDKSLNKEERELTVTRVKSSFNLVSESAYITAENNYEKKKNDRISKLNAIDSAYTNLNNLLNYKATNRYTLALELEYTKLSPGFNLIGAVSMAKDRSADIKSKSDDVNYTQMLIDTFEYNNDLSYQENQDNKKALEDKNNDARRQLADAVNSVEQKVMQGYNDILKAESQYESNQLDLEIQRKQHEINQAKFELGKITELELIGSLYQLDQLEETIRSQIVDHEILMKQITNPVLFTT